MKNLVSSKLIKAVFSSCGSMQFGASAPVRLLEYDLSSHTKIVDLGYRATIWMGE